jgi:hypothetical protein
MLRCKYNELTRDAKRRLRASPIQSVWRKPPVKKALRLVENAARWRAFRNFVKKRRGVEFL